MRLWGLLRLAPAADATAAGNPGDLSAEPQCLGAEGQDADGRGRPGVLPDRAPGDPGLVSPPGRTEVRQLGGSPVADQAKAADIRQLGSNWRATTRLGATPGSATRARAEDRYRPRSHLEPFKKFARTLRKHWREL